MGLRLFKGLHLFQTLEYIQKNPMEIDSNGSLGKIFLQFDLVDALKEGNLNVPMFNNLFHMTVLEYNCLKFIPICSTLPSCVPSRWTINIWSVYA